MSRRRGAGPRSSPRPGKQAAPRKTAGSPRTSWPGPLVFPHPLSWDDSYNKIPAVGFGNPWGIVSALVADALAAHGVVRVTRRDPVAQADA